MNKMPVEVANQLSEILSFIPEEIKNNIPNEIWQIINSKTDKSISTTINTVNDINERNILPETRKYLSFIFLNYLATEEEKEEYKKILKTNEEHYQAFLKEKFDVDEVFNLRKESMKINEKQQEKGKIEECTSLIEKKETLFSSIMMKIKRLFIKEK